MELQRTLSIVILGDLGVSQAEREGLRSCSSEGICSLAIDSRGWLGKLQKKIFYGAAQVPGNHLAEARCFQASGEVVTPQG